MWTNPDYVLFFFTDVNGRTTPSAIPYRQCMRGPHPVYAYIDHVSNHTEKAQPISGCAFYDSKGLYFDNDGQNHRPSLCLAVYEFPDMIFQGLLDQIPLGGPGFR